jgi:hypothetical protein
MPAMALPLILAIGIARAGRSARWYLATLGIALVILAFTEGPIVLGAGLAMVAAGRLNRPEAPAA